MRFVAISLLGLAALFGTLLLGAFLIGGDGDQRGVLGLLLLTAVGFILQYRRFSSYISESERLLSSRVYRLEERLKASHTESNA
jgi:hypothetical protein